MTERQFDLVLDTYQPTYTGSRDYRLFKRRWTGFLAKNTTEQDHAALTQWARKKFTFNRAKQMYIGQYEMHHFAIRVLFRSRETKDECWQFMIDRAAKRSVEFEVRELISMAEVNQQMHGRVFGVFRSRINGRERVWISAEDCPEAVLLKLAVG